MPVAGRIINDRFFLNAFLGGRPRKVDRAAGIGRRGPDADFESIESLPGIAVRNRGEMRKCVLIRGDE